MTAQPGDATALTAALTAALGELVRAVAEAPLNAREFLATCPFCRNRVLYLLDTAPHTGDPLRMFRVRIRELPSNHGLFHANQSARDHGDSRTPQIRGFA